jgi:hypothetical protein
LQFNKGILSFFKHLQGRWLSTEETIHSSNVQLTFGIISLQASVVRFDSREFSEVAFRFQVAGTPGLLLPAHTGKPAYEHFPSPHEPTSMRKSKQGFGFCNQTITKSDRRLRIVLSNKSDDFTKVVAS